MKNIKDHKAEHYFSKHPKSKARLGLIKTCLRRKPLQFLTSSGIFSQKHVDLGTRLLIECMILPSEGQVLDLGCGYGAVGIAAAVFNPLLRVVMVDVNDRAVRLSRMNIGLNKVANAEVRHGSLYESVEGFTFDCILSNPPVSAGLKTVTEMVAQAPNHMADKGKLEMVFRSKVAGSRLLSAFEGAFGNVCVLARGSGFRVLMAQKE